ncbi:transducin family protein / WD-40 repeat family protein [Artemisia annua]|uniref:Transducin family protein / WD-40 repeat family protein n=1 Tax=Artemisia annua TaxID=35608 RepID=A0A2U1N047_ARTAN|nr:transducin family protein / WD-40 repeat family protein [Artemisia annua]
MTQYMLLTCGSSEVLRLWDVETVLTSDPKKGICMWDCEGNIIKAWRGGRMPKVKDIAVTPNGENLISVSSDRDIGYRMWTQILSDQEIHMWDVEESWEKPLRYKGHRQEQYVIRSCFAGVNGTFIARINQEETDRAHTGQSRRKRYKLIQRNQLKEETVGIPVNQGETEKSFDSEESIERRTDRE